MSEVSTVQALEEQQSEMKLVAERGQMAMRLYSNPDFRKLIMEGFCVTDCARYARESGNPALPAENRADSLAMAQAAGHLKRFLSVTVQMGHQAERNLAELGEALDEVRAEEASGSADLSGV